MSNEPAVIVGLLQSVLALLVGFGVELSAEQVGLIMAAANALLAVVLRQQVTPVHSSLYERGYRRGGRIAGEET